MSHGYRPYRIEIQGTLVPKTAFHVGSGQSFHTSSDSPLLREGNDPAGKSYLPGSSLRGVLRSHLDREKDLLGCTQADIDSFFGSTGDDRGTYGRFQISNAYAEDTAAELRDHVRINEQWGAADSGAKFDMETGFAESFRFEAVYEGDSSEDREMRLFHEALRYLRSEGFRMGAKSAWGLGRMQMKEDLEVRQFDRGTDAGLLAYLQWRLQGTKPPSHFPTVIMGAPNVVPDAWNTITLKLELQFEGPVLVKSAIPASGDADDSNVGDPSTYWKRALANADGTFVTTVDPATKRFYLPGSSLRGVLRHEAIWIAGSDGLKEDLGLLFGTANERGGGSAGRLEIEDGLLVGDARIVALDHVAIDRIVQGAADGKKFDAAALESPKFSVRLVMRFEKENARLVRWLRAWLFQMENGRLWAGSGSARGYGLTRKVKVTEATVDVVDDLGWKPEGWAATPRNGRCVYAGTSMDPLWACISKGKVA
jgi:CRISPR/Cas system CSM-associated protein Csm3 (group 7 of RAMP superfamily)